jgi:hypothetical protein
MLLGQTLAAEEPLSPNPLTTNPLILSLDEVVLDIYNAVTELGEIDYEQLQSDLYVLNESPIDLNHTSEEELSQLHFLSPRQIDEILLYADKHPFESLYELRMIQSLADYEIRDLLPFVYINREALNGEAYQREALNPKNIFRNAKHEIITRVDARNIEAFEGTDPMYIQTRYRFDYQRRVIFGAQLRRPAGGDARSLQYGAYIQLRDIGHLHTLVAGNFQASFGQGLVLAPVFRSGRSAYVTSVGQTTEGLRYYSSVDGEGLHGAGATLRWEWNKSTRLDVSALYSLKRANDSIWHHLVGANVTVRHKRLQVQLTAIENIWSDSIRPYRNAAYNQHYFRGYNQAVLGASVRYNHGWFDAFAEVATAQNKENLSTLNFQLSTRDKWGLGVIAGSRFYPTSGVSLIALYRYYSPYFDNALGYAFSETSRLGDENGGYLGFEITRLKNWRFLGYGDLFYFSGPKYGIPQYPSIGYDALFEMQYHKPLNSPYGVSRSEELSTLNYSLRLRAKQKGGLGTYSTRAWFDYRNNGWSLRTTAEANIIPSFSEAAQSIIPQYGYTVFQDIAYDFTTCTPHHTPLSLRLRLQWFDAREWDNRIYCYEYDVLYAYSIPAVYGLGGRAFLCLRWQIIPQLTLYFRASETIYARDWYIQKHPSFQGGAGGKLPTRTDLHLLLRATL